MQLVDDLVAAAISWRQVSDNSTTTAEDVDLFPYSGLQHVGFFILFFFPALSLVVVLLRLWTRIWGKQFGWDDALITSAMCLSIAETGASYMGMRTAYLGVHASDIPPQADLGLGLRWNYILQLLYNPILALVKSSVLLFLLRLGGQKPGVRWTIHALNFFNLALMAAIFITVIFQCTPVQFFWDRAIEGGHCVDTGAFYVATAALTIFTDVLVLVLPFWIFLSLKMPSKIKIALLIVFGLGAVVTIISILRLVWLIDISFGDAGEDSTYDIRFTYSAVETNLAIICASAPALRGLVIKWFPRLFSSLGYGSNKYKSDDRYGSHKYGTSKYGNGTSTGGKGSGLRSFHRPTGNGTFQLEDMKGNHVKSSSTNTSEEEIMTYDGIMRTTQVDVEFRDKPSGSGSVTIEGETNQTRFGYD